MEEEEEEVEVKIFPNPVPISVVSANPPVVTPVCNCACASSTSTNLLLQLQNNLVSFQSSLIQLSSKVFQLESTTVQLESLKSKVKELEDKIHNTGAPNAIQNHLEPQPAQAPPIIYFLGPNTTPAPENNNLDFDRAANFQAVPTPPRSVSSSSSSSYQVIAFEDRLGSTRFCNFNANKRYYTCPTSGCSAIYNSLSELKNHFDSRHLDPSVQRCDYCGVFIQMVEDNSLAAHVQTCSSSNSLPLSTQPRVQPPIVRLPTALPPSAPSSEPLYSLNHRKILPRPTEILGLEVGDQGQDQMDQSQVQECPGWSNDNNDSSNGIIRQQLNEHLDNNQTESLQQQAPLPRSTNAKTTPARPTRPQSAASTDAIIEPRPGPSSPTIQVHSFEDKLGHPRQVNYNPSSGSYFCPAKDCSASRTRKNELKRHYNLSHLDPALHKCGYCGQIIKLVKSNSLARHVATCHVHDETCLHSLPGPSTTASPPPPPRLAEFKCKCCCGAARKGFLTQSELAEHYTLNHNRILGKPTGILRLKGGAGGAVDEIVIDSD